MSNEGKIQTVLGPISGQNLGVTLCHEHLYHKTPSRTFVPKPTECSYSQQLNSSKVSSEKLWYTNYHPYTHEDNLDFSTTQVQNALIEELKFFKQNGGHSVVEVTTFGTNFKILAQLSRSSGVNIVGNTGYYIAQAFPQSILTQSMESLYDQMKNELLHGVDGIKPGVIGEIASSWPIHTFERNVLLAAAHVQNELNTPVIIHPGRNPEAPFEVMRIFAEAGGKCAKTVMSHLDRTLDIKQALEFARTGTICELDLFGQEVSYYELSDEYDMPNDASRISMIKALVDEGYGEQITISHDIHTKHRLMAFGGHGFSHIMLNVLPKMRKRGINQQQIDQIMIHTPRKWLTWNTV